MAVRKQKDTEWASFELTERGILIIRWKPGSVITADAARAVLEEHVRICGDHVPSPVMVYWDQVKAFTKEARAVFANSQQIQEATSYVALLVSSPISRTLGNFYLGISKPRVPTRAFTDEQAALEWLEAQMTRG